jgi:predicted glycosyltransferase
MRILVALNHPAHYYLFKYTIIKLRQLEFTILYVIKDKDVLEKLLISEHIDYIKIIEKRKRNANIFSIILNGIIELITQDFNLYNLVRKWKPDLMIGTDISITHIGSIIGIPTFVFNEDDYEINKLFCNSAYPFATKIIAPNVCPVGRFENKRISYNGFQKMAYLNPKYFQPDKRQIEKLISKNDQYFLIRLVSLTSGHDIEGRHRGLNFNIVDSLIEELRPKGTVFISSEKKLNQKYEEFRLNIQPNKMHHLLAFASIFIGDSQTMCAEAGLLGTPFIRFNDFVGKIGVLNEIENKYQLGFGIKTDNPLMVLKKAKEILSYPDIKNIWQERRKVLFEEKVDVVQVYTNLIISQLTNTTIS